MLAPPPHTHIPQIEAFVYVMLGGGEGGERDQNGGDTQQYAILIIVGMRVYCHFIQGDF